MPDPTIYAASWLINPGADPVSGGAIAVRDGVVIAAGTLDDLKRGHSGPVVEYPGCAILPGLVNAHTHLELTHFSSWRLRLHVDYNPHRFVDWMIQLIKIKRGLTTADFEASIREGVRMCLESGTTAVGEIAGNPAMAPLYRSTRLGGRLFFELLGHDPARFHVLLGQALDACETGCSAPFLPGLSPHTAYTIGDDNLPLIREAALTRGLPLAIHLSESLAETAFIFDTSGPLAEELYPFIGWERYLTPPRRCSSTELLDRAGLLTPSTLAVHCVHINLADAEILKRRGVHAVLCPRSNERLDVGRAPLALLKKLGIPLALGTDSLASNESLSMWDEMRFVLEVFPHELSPEEVIHMATRGGAAALGIDSSCGSLEPGMRADFQVICNAGTAAEKLPERLIFDGEVQEVYTAGERYAGMISPPE